MNHTPLDHRRLYRLPWSLTDNIISWLEPTKECNIYCDGCYSANAKGSHKTLEEVRADLDVFERYRRTDAVSIAGGDPLVYPGIVEVVRMIAARGLKPVVNTNGHGLTPELLRELKAAGIAGFTFHVDSLQTRPGWKGKSELELNELRLEFAERVAEAGGISCAFNSTVYEKTLPHVPDILEWGRRHADKVHVLVFIAFRAAAPDRFEYFAGDKRVNLRNLTYTRAAPQRTDITAQEIVAEIRRRFPEFEPSAYLNGTEKPDSFKWLMTLLVGDEERFYGSAGPRFVELSQVVNHLWKGRYLGYVPPRVHANAKSLLALGAVDPGLRRAARNWLASAARNPLRAARPLHLQSVMIIQPVDVLDDGRQSMCDSCPDMTVHEGELVWSCRLDERLQYGELMRLKPVRPGSPGGSGPSA
ncbi:MAG TPA: radical SAM protein [Anaeromyxobacteraceae bacterium]|nr:radical SAM protein [Anaeromyxobacteraceae bacterium]